MFIIYTVRSVEEGRMTKEHGGKWMVNGQFVQPREIEKEEIK